MVTTCFVFISVEIDTFLHLASSNLDSLDGNSFVRSIEGELKVVNNFEDDVSCGQDVMSECNYIFTLNAMLQSSVIVYNFFNLDFSKSICMLRCPSFFNTFCFNNLKPSKCWSLDGDVETGVDVDPLLYSIV